MNKRLKRGKWNKDDIKTKRLRFKGTDVNELLC